MGLSLAQLGLVGKGGAQKLLSAEKGTQKIAVEVKSFVGLSAISEFYTAVDQFINYRVALKKLEPERVLYLAVPTDIYQNFFTDSFVQEVIEEYQIKVLVFHIQKQIIALSKVSTNEQRHRLG